jgi:hypothetical protein
LEVGGGEEYFKWKITFGWRYKWREGMNILNLEYYYHSVWLEGMNIIIIYNVSAF